MWATIRITVGDEVLIWGDTEHGRIQVLDVAEAMGSIPYEMTCGVSRRVPRVVVGVHRNPGND
jgi:alanine racemase